MNSGVFKYLFVFCIALTFLFKASNILSVYKNSLTEVEYSDSNKESTEKEEKRVEAEFFDKHHIVYNNFITAGLSNEKILLPFNFFTITYFPEVLTPPPSFLV